MISYYLNSQFKKMPWKNGQGTTTQILIHPENSVFEKNNFIYRLSSASVNSDGYFSNFSGMTRVLVPIKGAGFSLNGHIYEKFEVAHFSGEVETHCQLLKGPVADLGLIYDATKVKVHPRIIHVKSDLKFNLDANSFYFITVLQESVVVGDQVLKELETVQFQNEETCHLQVKKGAIALLVKMDFL